MIRIQYTHATVKDWGRSARSFSGYFFPHGQWYGHLRAEKDNFKSQEYIVVWLIDMAVV